MHVYIGDAGGRDGRRHRQLQQLPDRVQPHRRQRPPPRHLHEARREIEFNHVIGKGLGVTGIRHGGRGTLSGNRCENIDSVIVNGPDHQVRGN